MLRTSEAQVIENIWRLDGNAHDTAVMSSNFYHFAQRLFKD